MVLAQSHLTQNRLQALANKPIEFAESFLRVRDKNMRLQPLHYNKAQKHFLNNRTGRDLILKARQLGMSTMIQAEIVRLSWTRPTSSLTLADKGANMFIFRDMAELYYNELPLPESHKPVMSTANASITKYPDIGSQVAITTAGTDTSGRGNRFNVLHGSEVAFWKDAQMVMAGALQAVPLSGFTWVVLESTAYGAQGWFYNECMAALDGRSDWTLHFYEWWWDELYRIELEDGEQLKYSSDENGVISKAARNGFLIQPEQIKWRRLKQRELGIRFQQEYPESIHQAFVSSGNSVFGEFGHCLTTDRPTYNPDHRYVMGIDWGQENDYTSVSVFDATDMREVELQRWNKMRWDTMQDYIVHLVVKWGIEKVRPEKNSMGTVNIENLASKIEAKIINKELKRMPAISSFVMSNVSKQKLVQRLYSAIHDDNHLQLLDIDYATSELRSFVQTQTASGLYKFAASNEQHDDTVIARLLANDAAQRII